MPDQPAAESMPQETAPPTQAQLYDDLRRIGQLEDQKLAIQTEIDERTQRLRQAIPTLESQSLLYRMLTAALGTPTPKKAKPTQPRKRTARKRN